MWHFFVLKYTYLPIHLSNVLIRRDDYEAIMQNVEKSAVIYSIFSKLMF